MTFEMFVPFVVYSDRSNSAADYENQISVVVLNPCSPRSAGSANSAKQNTRQQIRVLS